MVDIARFGSSSFAHLFGIAIYGGSSDAWWHKILVRPVWNVGHALHNAAWWLRYRVDPKHRYHMIDTRLAPGYYDIDQIMENGMFALLRRYVEDEMGGLEAIYDYIDGMNNRDVDVNEPERIYESTIKTHGEIIRLYTWWMNELPAMRSRMNEISKTIHDQSRIEFKPVENGLFQMVTRPFSADETKLNEEYRQIEKRIEREMNVNLHRLVAIRGSLWT